MSIHTRHPLTNKLWVDPGPLCLHESASGGGCESTSPAGDTGSVHSGCAPSISATIKNTHCSASMRVCPELTVIGAEIDGGTITYEMVVGDQTIPLFTSNREPGVTHIGTEQVGHNVTGTTVATYSGTVKLACTDLAPGASMTLTAKPQIRRRRDNTNEADISWGTYRLDLNGSTC
jgi:hypothetical protein